MTNDECLKNDEGRMTKRLRAACGMLAIAVLFCAAPLFAAPGATARST